MENSSIMDSTKANKHIMLIDDSNIFLTTLTRLLESLGYTVEVYIKPGEALKALKEKDFFVVICDLHMGKINGYQLLHLFSQQKPEQVCCLLTSAENNELLLKKTIRLENVRSLLKKPVCVDKLSVMLTKIASLPKIEDHNIHIL